MAHIQNYLSCSVAQKKFPILPKKKITAVTRLGKLVSLCSHTTVATSSGRTSQLRAHMNWIK